jgi:hypothetical protein
MNLRTVIDNIRQQIAVLNDLNDLNDLDDQVSAKLRHIENLIRERKVQKVVSVPYEDGCQLAWSGAKGHWRLVLRDGDFVDPVMSLSRDERADILGSKALCDLLHAIIRFTEH